MYEVGDDFGGSLADPTFVPGVDIDEDEEDDEEEEEDIEDDEDEEVDEVDENIQQKKDNIVVGNNGHSSSSSAAGVEVPPDNEIENNQEVDINLNNVVSNFSVRCHLNLKQIAQTGSNVEYHKEMNMVIMKLRRPKCTASIWSSGKVTVTGSTSEEEAKRGARRLARILQRLGFNCRFMNFRIVNVLATCTMPFGIRIAEFSQAHPREASYEPELHPGVTFRLKEIEATLKIFSTGSITITAPNVKSVQTAVEKSFELVYEFRKMRSKNDPMQYPISERKRINCNNKRKRSRSSNNKP